jgi:hypothetical protein
VTDNRRLVEGDALAALRAQGRAERGIGFVACLVGVVMLALAHGRVGGQAWLVLGGIAVIGIGWVLFVISLARRLVWLRAHKDKLRG